MFSHFPQMFLKFVPHLFLGGYSIIPYPDLPSGIPPSCELVFTQLIWLYLLLLNFLVFTSFSLARVLNDRTMRPRRRPCLCSGRSSCRGTSTDLSTPPPPWRMMPSSSGPFSSLRIPCRGCRTSWRSYPNGWVHRNFLSRKVSHNVTYLVA